LVLTFLMLIANPTGAGQLLLFTGVVLVPAAYVRVFYKAAKSKSASLHSSLYASFIVLGKFPEVQGLLHYYLNKLLGKTSKIIEYKIDNKIESKGTQGSDSSLKD